MVLRGGQDCGSSTSTVQWLGCLIIGDGEDMGGLYERLLVAVGIVRVEGMRERGNEEEESKGRNRRNQSTLKLIK